MDVLVPDLGDFADVEVIELLVKAGDSVVAEDPLITLETEKATMDVPSPTAGRILEVKVAVGDKVSTGDLIVVLEGEGAEATLKPPSAEPSSASAEAAATPAPAQATGTSAETAADEAAATPAPELVTVPDLGDFTDVEVIEVLVAAGQDVEIEQGLVTLETEKATMDVPSTLAGTVLEVKLEVGARVNPGDAIALIQPQASGQAGGQSTPGEAPSAEALEAERRESVPSASELAAQRPRQAFLIDEAGFSRAHASPSIRKLARELGVDLGRVQGSGSKGRVTAEDVKAFVKGVLTGASGTSLPKLPEVDFAKFGPVTTEPLSRIQRISGPRLHASWVNLPHVTQHDEADITELEDKRKALKDEAAARGIRLTPLAFILRAVALALSEFPQFKSSLSSDAESLVLKQYTHIGFAADTPNGLVVPVIRDADRKDVYELAEALGTLSEAARAGKLKADDISGGVFTVSSLGGIGGTFFTPIINAPEVAILGVSRHRLMPVWDGERFVPRLMLPLSLSYDHRVIDGANAVRFTTRLGEILADVDRLMEAQP